MNTLTIHKSGKRLDIKLSKPFNLRTKNEIESRLDSNINKLNIDLKGCTLIDSEGVIFMYKWKQSGKILELKNPPDILFEILDILELRDTWN